VRERDFEVVDEGRRSDLVRRMRREGGEEEVWE
jgi:hypothetical protein